MRNKKMIVSIDDGSVYLCDTLTIGKRRWIIRKFEEADAPRQISFKLLIDGLKYRSANPDYGADFVLEDTLPVEVWNGTGVNSRFTTENFEAINLGVKAVLK